MTDVTIIDYGLCNLLNVTRAFNHLGAKVTVTGDPDEVDKACKLVLPGVGAFSDGMAGLERRGLVEPVRMAARRGTPILSICLGMQMLMDYSEEFGMHDGLGLIPGKVIRIPATGLDGKPHKIPHIGWNELVYPKGRTDWELTFLAACPVNTSYYFVHSYMAVPQHDAHRIADCLYDGQAITAVVQKDNVIGCQFHPERSGENGLQLLRDFISF